MEKAIKRTKIETLLDRIGAEKRIDYSLERFQEALKSIGSPHENVKSLIISGTNGKGTTTLFLSSGLIEAGNSVATFLSPHLSHVKERFLHNFNPIKESKLEALAEEHIETGIKYRLTYFEFLTLLFFVWAKEIQADFLVLEVGLGGRLDATNVTDPIACVLTQVDLDHQALLGATRPEILREKLGILRKESLLFTGEKDPGLLKTIEDTCNELDAIYYFSKELQIQPQSVDLTGQTISINGYPFTLKNPSVGTIENAALAFLTLRITFPVIPITTFQRAFAKVQTPGRMEVLQKKPTIIFSGDHNLAGIECLKATLDRLGVKRPKILCGFSYDKPYQEMYQNLKALASDILLTSAERNGKIIPDEYKELGDFEPHAVNAYQRMVTSLSESDTLIVTGSLYLVGELKLSQCATKT